MPGKNVFDAIVIGSGISGGWAAKELCEHGLKTLVLERGRSIEHIKDYPTATMNPWDFAHRGANTDEILKENPVISKCYAFTEDTRQFFVKDAEHPYVQEKPFDWIRGYQVGGKSITWAAPVSDGVILNLHHPRVSDMRSTGRSAIRTSHTGTDMWKDLQASAEAKTDSKHYRMAIIFRHLK
ncbi:MAG: hypothetical protein WDM78_02415 [Puia sp.]